MNAPDRHRNINFKYTVGRVDGAKPPVRVRTYRQALQRIQDIARFDAIGVTTGEYYIDGPTRRKRKLDKQS